MDEDQMTITALRDAVDTALGDRRLAPDAAQRAWAAGRTPRRSHRTWLAVAATVAAVAGAATVVAVTGPGAGRSGSPAGGRSACVGVVQHTPLPTWAQAGFTPPGDPIAHVTGAHGRIVGVLFVQPLRVHQPTGTNNKLLWVAKTSSFAPLVIRASLENHRVTVVRTVPGGPGPSYLDLPAAGCWQLSLTWGDQHDTVAVPYSP